VNSLLFIDNFRGFVKEIIDERKEYEQYFSRFSLDKIVFLF